MSRSPMQQWFHDRVIETVATRENLHAVYPNVGRHRNVCVTIRRHEVYPDIVLCDRESFRIEHLMEVETEESLSEEKAQKWALEARGPWQLWLLVPRAAMKLAAQLCRRYGIHAHLVPWSPLESGIEIKWPAPALASYRTAWWR